MLGDRDFCFVIEALLPLLDLGLPSECALGLRDFIESLDLERLRDFLSADGGDGERE